MLQPHLFTQIGIFHSRGHRNRDSRNSPRCYLCNNTWSRMLHLLELSKLRHLVIQSCYIFVFLCGGEVWGGGCPSSDNGNKDSGNAF